jgi:hypothetical protein
VLSLEHERLPAERLLADNALALQCPLGAVEVLWSPLAPQMAAVQGRARQTVVHQTHLERHVVATASPFRRSRTHLLEVMYWTAAAAVLVPWVMALCAGQDSSRLL